MNAKKATAMIGIKADSKSLDPDIASAKKKLRGFAGFVDKINGGKKMGKVWGAAKGTVTRAAGAIGSVVTSGLVDAATSTIDFEKSLTRLQVATNSTASEMDAIRSSIMSASKATGVNRGQILDAAAEYVRITGDAKGARQSIDAFARAAQASGSESKDLASTAAALHDAFGLDPKDFEAAFSSLIAQGKAGSVELSDLAKELTSVAPQFADVASMGGLGGIGELGASLQIARKNFGSASEAANGLRAMMRGITQHAADFEKQGVKIFNKDLKTGEKRMRPLSQIWKDINNSKIVNDPTLLQKAFGSDEAKRTYDAFRKFPALYEELLVAGRDFDTVNRDLGTVLSSNGGRLDVAMNNLKLSLAEAFTPERIEAFVNGMERAAKFAGAIADSAGSFMSDVGGKTAETDNPFLYGDAPATLAGPGREAYARLKKRELEYNATLYGRDSEAGQKLVESNQYDAASAKIKYAGSRKDQIKAAIAAKAANYEGLVPGIVGSGSGGTGMAGQDWMRRLTPSAEEEKAARAELNAERDKQMKTAIDAMGNKVVDALKNGITVKIDGGAVQQKIDNAPTQRSGRK